MGSSGKAADGSVAERKLDAGFIYVKKSESWRARCWFLKKVISSFMDQLCDDCTYYYEPLIPHVKKLRQKVFLDGRTPDKPNRKLYSEMIEVLGEAQEDPRVLQGMLDASGASV
ncbi:hypothetical protein E4U59_002040 [Claviceps monticola]|nr:hypothetical protein E4U59_002040 [Claviceps monticola]